MRNQEKASESGSVHCGLGKKLSARYCMCWPPLIAILAPVTNAASSALFDAPVYKTYGGLIADGTFEPAGFAAPLGYKDIRLTLAAAEDLRVPLPLASLLRDRFLTLLAHGGDKLDWSAIGRIAATDAGEAAS